MGTDRININAPTIKEDGAFQNDLRSAKSVDDIVRASQSLRERAQGVVYDPVSGQYRESAPAASATEREFTTKTVEIGGREFTFTASSEAEMAALISNAQLVAENVAAPARGEDGRFTHNDNSADDGGAEAARQAGLELKFRRGEISVKDYISESGTVGQWLQDQGVSIEDLQATAQQRDAEAYAQDWQNATQTFLAGPGSEWPGGEANKINLQNALVALNLMDADDKVGALVEAFDYMKRNNALIPYEQTNSAVSAAISKELATASPEELLAAWKEQYASGGDASAANRALIESFRRK